MTYIYEIILLVWSCMLIAKSYLVYIHVYSLSLVSQENKNNNFEILDNMMVSERKSNLAIEN